MAMIQVKNLTRIFDVSKPWLNRVIERLPKAMLTAVSDVSFDVEERTVYSLVGESGSGKSTIGKMAVGLLKPTDGSVLINDIDLSRETDGGKLDKARSDIQMIFQDPYASSTRDGVCVRLSTNLSLPVAELLLALQKSSLSKWACRLWTQISFPMNFPAASGSEFASPALWRVNQS